VISRRLLVAFSGTQLPPAVGQLIAQRTPAGVSLFRFHNSADPPQLRALTDSIQAAAPVGARPLLIAADQEGGQLIALADGTTPFAGAMAVGAAGDGQLAERVGRAVGAELRALGVNINYAPVCDLASNPANPALGIRSFGDDPAAVGQLAAATVRGLQSSGVAATLKHFPGGGDTEADPHHELPLVPRTDDELAARELVPFAAALAAGARLVMTGHFALPHEQLPASLSRHVVIDILRERLGFNGLAVTDALDMRALAQGAAQVVDAIVALRAGEDLLLGTPDEAQLVRLAEGLAQAELRSLLGPDDAWQTRLAELRSWLAGFEQPSLDVVGCAEHQALAAELARRSITLVRNDDGLLPLKGAAQQRIAVVHSQPANLTPADTSSLVKPTLASALRRRLPAVTEYVLPQRPTATDIAALVEQLPAFDLVVVGTFAANLQSEQASLAQAMLASAQQVITVALRTPWDLLAYPAARTHVCSYGILEPTTEALAGALLGEFPFGGRLPVELNALYQRGHGMVEWA
jgi:beta-N-acetylhexosaminidase